jgi:hypothetical protein
MAEYVDEAFSYLQGWSNTFKTHYYPGIADFLQRFGKITRLMPSKRTQLNGRTMQIEVKGAHNRSTRLSHDLMDAMPDPGPGHYARYNLTFDETSAADNNFPALEIGWRTNIYNIWKQADSNWKGAAAFIRKDIDEGMADIKETLARYLHLPTDGKLATLDATTPKKNDDADNWTDATTYTSGSTTCRIKCQPFSIGRIGIGQIIEIRTSGGELRMNNVKVVDVNPYDKTLDIKLDADTNRQSVDSAGADVTTFNAIAASDTLYLSGNYNQAVDGSLAAFFDYSTNYYDADRSTFPNQILMPIVHALAASGSTVALTEDHLVTAGETGDWQQGDANAKSVRVMSMARDQFRAIRKIAKDGAMTFVPGTSSEVGKNLKRVLGEDGFVLHDPNFGQVAVMVEDFAEYGVIDFLDMSTWEIVEPFSGGFRMLPGNMTGFWSREGENDGSGRLSKRFAAQGLLSLAIINRGAKRNLRLKALDSTA